MRAGVKRGRGGEGVVVRGEGGEGFGGIVLDPSRPFSTLLDPSRPFSTLNLARPFRCAESRPGRLGPPLPPRACTEAARRPRWRARPLKIIIIIIIIIILLYYYYKCPFATRRARWRARPLKKSCETGGLPLGCFDKQGVSFRKGGRRHLQKKSRHRAQCRDRHRRTTISLREAAGTQTHGRRLTGERVPCSAPAEDSEAGARHEAVLAVDLGFLFHNYAVVAQFRPPGGV